MKARLDLLSLCVTLLLKPPSSSEAAGGPYDGGGNCTSGFMSLERMRAVLSRGTLTDFDDYNLRAIIPGMNFTCSGNISRWTFGAEWYRNTGSSPELQIWRSSGDGSYTRVRSTTIMTEENTTRLYEYPLSSPLPFQEGDILGFYQPSSSEGQLGLQFETGHGHRLYDAEENSANTNIEYAEHLILVAVETDPPGCGCGFMSVERMRILLGLDSVGNVVTRSARQQITPDMRFTCDGIITKWIIGARRPPASDHSSHPELQLWRKTGNDTYQKIIGTNITESGDRVYEYDNFLPITFQTGDILGVFIPQFGMTKLILRSEDGYGPTNYYISTGADVTMSPYETIDLHQNTPQIQSDIYHPLVTVEISVSSTTISATPTDMSSTTSATTTTTNIPGITASFTISATATTDASGTTGASSPPETYVSSTTSATDTSTATTVPTPPDVSTDSGSQSSVGVGVGGGVGAAVVLLVVVGVLGVGLFCVWRRRHTSKVPAPAGEDVGRNIPAAANALSKKEMEMSCNVAYGVTKSTSFTGEDEYDYIPTTDGNDIITTSPNEAYATTDNVPASSNQAYGIVQH